MGGPFFVAKGRTIVCLVMRDDDSMLRSGSLKEFLGPKSLMGVETNLEGDVNKVTGMIDKDTSTSKFV